MINILYLMNSAHKFNEAGYAHLEENQCNIDFASLNFIFILKDVRMI